MEFFKQRVIKYFIALVVGCLLVTSVGCTSTSDVDILPTVTTVTDITDELLQVEYTDDRWFDHWQNPQETWRKMSGDCEDYALLAVELLRQIGIEGNILVVNCKPKYPMGNHAVCVFKDDDLTGGTYWFWSNAILRKTELTDIQDVVYRVRHKSWIKSWKLIGSDGKVIRNG